jgi:hypothetical protein
MKNIKKLMLSLFVVIGLVFAGCDTESSDDTTDIIVADSTVVADDEEVETIFEIATPVENDFSQGCSITIPSSSDLARQLKPGEVLSCSVTDKTPFGLLQKIVSVENQGETTVVQTEPAALNEAFEELHIDSTIELEPSNVRKSIPLIQGVTFSPGNTKSSSRAGISFTCNFVNVVLASGSGGSIRANGSVSVGISTQFICDISWFHIDRIGFRVDLDEEARLEITAAYDADLDIEIPVLSQYFNPIVIMAGYVPIVIVPSLSIIVGLDGHISASVTAGIVQYSHFDSSTYYRSSTGQWTTEEHKDSDFSPIMPQAEFSCSAKAYAGPYLDIMLYGIVGPYVCARGYLDLNVYLNTDPPPIPWLTLDAGLEIGVGINLTPIADALSWIGIDIDGRYEAEIPLLEVRILELPTVDLTPVNLEAISTTYLFVYGTPIEFSVQVENTSDFDAPEPFTVRWELYNPGTSVPTYTHDETITSLAANTTSGQLWLSWTPQSGVDAGTKRIVVKVDPENTVFESNESNNEIILDITIIEYTPT